MPFLIAPHRQGKSPELNRRLRCDYNKGRTRVGVRAHNSFTRLYIYQQCKHRRIRFSNNSPLPAYFRHDATVVILSVVLGLSRWRAPRTVVNYMKRFSSFARGALLIALGASQSISAAAADERTIKVELDYARIVKIPDGAQTLVIGNPLVADVTMLKTSQLMVITGKSFGTTNLIVLDRSGQQVGESIVTVVPAEDKVVVQRGAHRESYSCHPKCARAVDMADDSAYMTNVIGSVKAHDDAAGAARK